MKRRGFSLVELLLSMGLMVLLLGIGVLQTRSGRSAGAQGLAQVVAAELQAAREQAITSHSTVGVVFPSAAGTRPHCQSLYILTGLPNPKVTRVLNLAGDFPGSYLFVGTWAGPTASLEPPVWAGSLAGWLNPPTKDYVIAFSWDGKVFSNDLPWLNGSLNIVACNGLQYSASGAPTGTSTAGASAPSYFSLTQVNQPYTVSIDSGGGVSVDQGLRGQSGVAVVPGSSLPAWPPAAPPALATGGNTDPEIVAVEAYPRPNDATSDAGFTTQVNAGGYATLTVKARDVDGDRLAVNWVANAGTFSYPPGGGAMRYDPSQNLWVSNWVWTPPEGAANNSTYALNCTVTDDRGGSATVTGDSTVSLRYLNQRKIAFAANFQGRSHLYILYPDGSAPECLSQEWVDGVPGDAPSDYVSPCLSPDGSTLVYTRTPPNGSRELWLCGADGQGRRIIDTAGLTTGASGGLDQADWGPDGSLLVATRYLNVGGTDPELRILRTDGTQPWPSLFINGATRAAWSPKPPTVNPTRIAYVRNERVYFQELDTSTGTLGGEKLVSADLPQFDYPAWDPSGDYLVYVDTSNQAVMVANVSVPAPFPTSNISPSSMAVTSRLAFIPNNTEVLFAMSGGLWLADVVPTFSTDLYGLRLLSEAFTDFSYADQCTSPSRR